jgi:gas vesicle protein
MSNRDAGNFFTGMIIGTVIGLALGFLFAPQSGEETRELIRSKARVAQEKAADLSEKVKKTSAEIKDKIQSQLD